MIKAEELKIGNLIQDLEIEPYYFEVEELRKYVGYSIWAFYRKGSVKAKEVEPIPLTEEWLVRFGFEKQMAWTYRKHISGNNYLVYYLGEKGWSINNKNYSDFNCQYVHQLQNLYFALTQTELTPSDGGKIE